MQAKTADAKSFLKFYDKICDKQHTMNGNDFAVFMGKECADYIARHQITSETLVGMQLHIWGRGKGPPV